MNVRIMEHDSEAIFVIVYNAIYTMFSQTERERERERFETEWYSTNFGTYQILLHVRYCDL